MHTSLTTDPTNPLAISETSSRLTVPSPASAEHAVTLLAADTLSVSPQAEPNGVAVASEGDGQRATFFFPSARVTVLSAENLDTTSHAWIASSISSASKARAAQLCNRDHGGWPIFVIENLEVGAASIKLLADFDTIVIMVDETLSAPSRWVRISQMLSLVEMLKPLCSWRIQLPRGNGIDTPPKKPRIVECGSQREKDPQRLIPTQPFFTWPCCSAAIPTSA